MGTAAVDAAGDGDTIFVRSGVCDEKWMWMQRARGVRLDVASGANARECRSEHAVQIFDFGICRGAIVEWLQSRSNMLLPTRLSASCFQPVVHNDPISHHPTP